MTIYKMEISQWRQFEEIDIDFHPRLTIITGSNGSGKSTLLSIASLSFKNNNVEPFIATPVTDKKTGKSVFSFGTLFRRAVESISSSAKRNPRENRIRIGSIEYNDGNKYDLAIPPQADLKYKVQLLNDKSVKGFKIDSHRAVPRYQEIDYLPVKGVVPGDAFDHFREAQYGYQVGETYSARTRNRISNPVAPLKETLISFAAFGADNEDMKAVPELRGLFRDFQKLLGLVLPEEIGFQSLEVRSPEVVVVTKTGEFPIDSASGGLMSLIQTAWQIFLFEKANPGWTVVLIDEPENHLHPSLQRNFLARLVDAFEQVQFVVATHSPFIISSVKDSYIHALRYKSITTSKDVEANAITSEKINLAEKASSASDILEEVLGVAVTIPVWAEGELEKITEKFDKTEDTKQAIENLKTDLRSAGLEKFLPEAIGRAVRD